MKIEHRCSHTTTCLQPGSAGRTHAEYQAVANKARICSGTGRGHASLGGHRPLWHSLQDAIKFVPEGERCAIGAAANVHVRALLQRPHL